MAMVTEPKENGVEPEMELPPALLEKPAGLPPGKYALVGWDMDTTGRRLMDEICQIAAYTPTNSYSQYIMPYRDLNPGARRRHNVRVVTVGRYRMLKDISNDKILKTKSEISALTEFLEWLEKEKGDTDGVILIYHEPRRLSPIMLLEALNRYKLVERFSSCVRGFADGYALAAEQCRQSVKSVSLRVLARVLLDKDAAALTAASDRAAAAYQVVSHLAQGTATEVGAAGEAGGDAVDLARRWTRPVAGEHDNLTKLRALLERQNSFRAVFSPLLRGSRLERQRVTSLRRELAASALRLDALQAAWTDAQRDGLEKQLSVLSDKLKPEELKELVDILDCHFDPAKEPKRANPRPPRNHRKHAGASTSSAGDADSPRHSTDAAVDSSQGAVDKLTEEIQNLAY